VIAALAPRSPPGRDCVLVSAGQTNDLRHRLQDLSKAALQSSGSLAAHLAMPIMWQPAALGVARLARLGRETRVGSSPGKRTTAEFCISFTVKTGSAALPLPFHFFAIALA